MGVEKVIRCLSNSFSRFIHLVTFGVPKNLPCQQEYKDVAGSLKLFKRILDSIDDTHILSDEILHKEFEELDLAVNEAREFIENWGFHSSKICGVVQSRQSIVKIRSYSIKICETVFRSLEASSSSSISTSLLADIQHCMDEFKSLKLETAFEKLEEAMELIKEGKVPPLEHLTEIIELLHLSTSHELLKESIAVEKENMKVDQSNQVNHIADLIFHIRETMVNLESLKAINGVSVPSYFICPLSLQLMFDPVIVATGQTYERNSIKKWLDHGLMKCPVTRQTLSHTNLIPNYTVKALISNWCDENNVKVNRTVGHGQPEYDTPKDENGFDHRSPVESCSHSRTGSTSTAVSSSDYQHVSVSHSGEMVSDSGFSPWLPDGGNRSYPRTVSLSDASINDITTSSLIENLVNDLKSNSNSAQTKAAAELRFLAKNNLENRIMIGKSGAIQPLLSLLRSNIKITQEHAVTALLNLSINGNIKLMIAESGAIDPLIHVLETGNSCAKENAAAALFSLSLLEEYRVKIGQSGAVKPLVDLLRSGTLRGKKDAATALFNLSIFHENKARIIQAGAVKYLVELMEPESEMVDKSVALLSNLSSVSEGCLAIAKEGGIPLLVEVVESGTPRGKENAASILLQLCLGSPKYCRLVLQEGAVPPLVALSQSGTSRAKEKAQQLLSHFRSQRENASGRGKC